MMFEGVLWSGDTVLEGTVETLEGLRQRGISYASSQVGNLLTTGFLWERSTGKQVVFVTNNSTKSRANYKDKLTKMGIPATEV